MTLYFLIALCGFASYFMGARRILANKYKPNTFSRVVWVILAINSFAGVYYSHSSPASIFLALVMLLGNVLICALSFTRGTRHVGPTEYACLILLFVSLFIWIFFNSPLINLLISLFAHFIGAVPTFKNVWLNPFSEDIAFWGFFFLASLFSVFNSDFLSVKAIIFPLYYVFFDGGIVLLAARRYLKQNPA